MLLCLPVTTPVALKCRHFHTVSLTVFPLERFHSPQATYCLASFAAFFDSCSLVYMYNTGRRKSGRKSQNTYTSLRSKALSSITKRAWERGESLGTRREPGNEERAWERGESLGTRREPGNKEESLGTRREPGNKERAWERGESLGTR